MMLLLLLSMVLTFAQGTLVDEVKQAFDTAQFRDKRAECDGEVHQWNDWNGISSRFDQGESGLCSLYAATAVSRTSLSVQEMKDANGAFWAHDDRFRGVIDQGFDGQFAVPVALGENHRLQAVYPLNDVEAGTTPVTDAPWEDFIDNPFAGVRLDANGRPTIEADLRDIVKRSMGQQAEGAGMVLARLMSLYPDVGAPLRDSEFKGFLLFTGEHTIGMPYADGEYRLFDSLHNKFGTFFNNSRAIGVVGAEIDTIAQEVTDKWLNNGHRYQLESVMSATAVFGPRRVQAGPTPAERRAAELAEAARLDEQRREAARLEQARIDAERAERVRIEAERAERARIEAERAERARIEAERAERARIEAERLEIEARIEEQRIELEFYAAQRAEAQRVEAERVRAEAERAAAVRAELRNVLRQLQDGRDQLAQPDSFFLRPENEQELNYLLENIAYLNNRQAELENNAQVGLVY